MSGIHHPARSSLEPAHPRVVFAAFRASDDPMLQAWGRFRERVLVGGRADGARTAVIQQARPAHVTDISGASGIWRLLASNNRELGRSYHLYSSFDTARNHVLRLRDAADDMEVVLVQGQAVGAHGWVALIGGVPMMTCGRWYGSPSATHEAAAGALAALPRALVAEDAQHTAPSGRRSRRFVTTDPAFSW